MSGRSCVVAPAGSRWVAWGCGVDNDPWRAKRASRWMPGTGVPRNISGMASGAQRWRRPVLASVRCRTQRPTRAGPCADRRLQQPVAGPWFGVVHGCAVTTRPGSRWPGSRQQDDRRQGADPRRRAPGRARSAAQFCGHGDACWWRAAALCGRCADQAGRCRPRVPRLPACMPASNAAATRSR